ncbi:MAG TPA: ABC transporter permease, partial [Hymenobacter sp.]
MIPALKAEFRKLLTVRSTYILALVCLAITVLLALYIFGYRTASTPGAVIPSILYTSAVVTVIPAISLFIALAAVLLVTHEYRYNTIGYSLTAARQRWVVVVAKIIAITVFAVIVSLVCAALVPVLARLGLQLGGATQVTQDFNMADMLLRAVFYGWASAMLGLLIALIIRSQVGAIVTILLFPGLGESLLSLVLKDNAKYL